MEYPKLKNMKMEDLAHTCALLSACNQQRPDMSLENAFNHVWSMATSNALSVIEFHRLVEGFQNEINDSSHLTS
jgi:hypothetical protein